MAPPLDRLAHSADGLGLDVPDPTRCAPRADAVLAANELTEAASAHHRHRRCRPLGLGARRPDRRPSSSSRAPLDPAAPTADVVVVPWTRNERGATAGLKTISYAENVRALAYAEARGASEAIFANTQGELCEATGSNVFLVHDGTLVHAPGDGRLPARRHARGLLLELCGTCEERDVPIDALAAADEAFLSSTTREVHRSRTSTGRVARCARPRREGAGRGVQRARRARPRSLTRAQVDHVGRRDRGLGAVVGPHDEMSVRRE